MTFLDLFAGIGGFRRGMEIAGHKCIGFCEYDKFAVASYTSMHLITEEQREYLSTLTLKKRQKEILKEEYRNGEWYAKDIREVTGENIPKADCWCFGSPCQDFSVAGMRAGLEGSRSSLVHEIFRILKEIKKEDRPKWIIYENVKGMLSSNRGFDFLAILLEMDECGYDIQWQLLNSKYHGVPQNRERVYTIGCLRGKCSSKIFPFEGTDTENSVCELNVKTIGHRKSYNNNTVVVDSDGIARTLDTAGGGGRELHIAIDVDKPQHKVITVGNTNPSGKGMNGNCYYSEGINPAITCNKNEGNRIAIPVNAMPDGTCRTLKHQYQKNNSLNFNSNGDRGATAVGIPVCIGGFGEKKSNGGSQFYQQDRIYSSDTVSPSLTHNLPGGSNRVAIPVLTPDRANKRQNGRRFKEDGEEAFTLTGQDRHGVVVSVHPMEISGNYISESENVAHCLNCNDQRKIFGANQKRTMVGYDVNDDRQ